MDTTPSSGRMEPLWDRVDANRLRLLAHVSAFVVLSAAGIDLLAALGIALSVLVVRDPYYPEWLFGHFWYALGWVSLAGLALGTLYVAWRLTEPERYILRRLGAEFVPKGEELETKFALKDMANAAGFRTAPALYVIDTPNVNAFVLGRSNRRGMVGVTSGFMRRLSVDEQRAAFSNLVVRLRAGDTIWATGMSAILGPLYAVRTAGIRSDPIGDLAGAIAESEARSVALSGEGAPRGGAAGALVWVVLFGLAFVVVSELIAAGLRSTQVRHSEKADAEGMLLLRDPVAALSALQTMVRTNNLVPRAGAGMAYLFYSWPADGATDDASDPERRRVLRLREVLGVEGATWRDEMGLRSMSPEESAALDAALPPLAPRIEDVGDE